MESSHVIDGVFGETLGKERPSQSGSFRRIDAGLERVLIVEPDETRLARLGNAVREVAETDSDADFLTARRHLFSKQYDWLVTNGRLGAYNGLHLVHLARTSQLPIRFLVYADRSDLWLAREAQRVGAFYESGDRVDVALPAYLRGALPPKDRRNPGEPDRRGAFRGSRRCTDAISAKYA